MAIELSAKKGSGDKNQHSNDVKLRPSQPLVNPEFSANLFSRYTYSYMSPLIQAATKQALTPKDLWSMFPGDDAASVTQTFGAIWSQECQKPLKDGQGKVVNRLLNAVRRFSLGTIMWIVFFKLVISGMRLALPEVFALFLTWLGDYQSSDAPLWEGLLLAAIFFLVPVAAIFIETRIYHKGVRTSLQIQSAVIALVFDQSLSLSASARGEHTTGQIVNLVGGDAGAVAGYVTSIPEILVQPIFLAAAVWQLSDTIGWGGASAGVLLLFLPLMGHIMGRLRTFYIAKLGHSDARVKIINEILQGVRIVKSYAWELPFLERVNRIRAQELGPTKKLAICNAYLFFMFFLLPTCISFAGLAIYAGRGGAMTAPTIFKALQLFNLLSTPLFSLPAAIGGIIGAGVSSKRIQKFLVLQTEATSENRASPDDSDDSTTDHIEGVTARIVDGNFSWNDVKLSDDEAAVKQLCKAVQGMGTTWPDFGKKWVADILAKHQGSKDGENGAIRELATAMTDDKAGQHGLKDATAARKATIVELLLADESPRGFRARCQAEFPAIRSTFKLAGAKIDTQTNASTEADKASSESSESEPFKLVDINFTAAPGKLTAIVGPVGSGKSSLLAALLGEMQKTNGEVILSGSVSLVAQSAWIQNKTIRDNITFGAELDEDVLQLVLDDCALRPDIKILPGGLATEIGDRGINLSGGQKQRVALARAVYANADTVLLDDPLSALDAHVAGHVFEKCVLQRLAGKTRVLVTNQLQVLKDCDAIFVLKEGRITESGTFQELKARGGDFADLMSAHHDQQDKEAVGTQDVELSEQAAASSSDAHHSASELVRRQSSDPTSLENSSASSQKPSAASQTGGKTQDDEELNVGAVSREVYWSYFRLFGGKGFFTALLVLAFFSQAITAGMRFFVAIWIEDSLGVSNWTYIGLLAALGVLGSVLTLGRQLLVAHGAVRASSVLHRDLVASILRAAVAFFDRTPVGRVLNRCSADIGQIDMQVHANAELVLGLMLTVAFNLISVVVISPLFFVPLLLAIFLYRRLQAHFAVAALQIRRINSVVRSPLASHFTEALLGIETIRAFDATRRFVAENATHVDTTFQAAFMHRLVFRWANLRQSVLQAFLLFAVVLLIIWDPFDNISVALAGVGILAVTSMSAVTFFLLVMATELESGMNAVERVLHYSTDIRPEAEWTSAGDEALLVGKDGKSWPSAGAIEISSLTMRYRESIEPAIRDLTVSIRPGEKIGICGRTGSGKSTLMLALMRFYESSPSAQGPLLSTGCVKIDGLDTRDIGLHALRKAMAIIPQDAVIFSGTVRYNLDPFSQATDEDVWAALRSVDLFSLIDGFDDKLEAKLSEYGSNLSAGQRQLLCIARAILRRPKILLLDEATSSIDAETDQRIQLVLRDQFRDCTVLTIAHRLNTIRDSDRIMLLRQGRLVEFDSPDELLRRENGEFAALHRAMIESHSH